jgi:hypothetical protein
MPLPPPGREGAAEGLIRKSEDLPGESKPEAVEPST